MNKGNGTIRKLSDNCWEGRFYVDGKRQHIYAPSYMQVRKQLTSQIKAVNEGLFVEETDSTVAEWLQEWIEDYLDIKPSTHIRYERDIRLYINPAIGKVPLSELTSVQVQRLYHQCRKIGLSPKSIHNLHGILHEALKVAVKMDLLRKNVSDNCDLPKVRKVQMNPLTDKQVPIFLKSSAGDEFEYEYFVALFTGLRESEIVGLTWDCIDFERKTLRVYRQYNRLGSRDGHTVCGFSSCKNDRERLIEPGNRVMEVFRKIRIQQKEMRLRAGDQWDETSNFVFTKRDGSPIQYQTMYKHFKKIVTVMGIPQVRFHDLRHTYATLSLQNGVDVKTISASLGHATAAFTLDKYGHVSNEMRHQAAEKMDRFIARL